MRRKILTVVGARPQFIKAGVISRLIREKHAGALEEIIVHTGQHYDDNMSRVFFEQLDLPEPKINLGVGSGGHGEQTAKMLSLIEREILSEKPDLVLVYGDTNSTLAGGLAAAKLHVPVAHVEAGLRSWNRKMPEEINRVMVDHLSSLLLCPSDRAVENLKKEGIVKGVVKTGDVMHDSAIYCARRAEEHRENFDRIRRESHIEPGEYFLATVHRAENTDHPDRLERIVSAFGRLPAKVVWPVHPRTLKELKTRDIACGKNIVLTGPFSYLDMLLFLKYAKTVLTDSGGVQKEALFFKVPCITLREETEWTETVDSGWNILTGTDAGEILSAVSSHLNAAKQDPGEIYGDGNSGRNAIESLLSFLGKNSR
ncbi:MAG: UDP-N-acetylglucosamine 2-epimerase (non-hydrolyzing) [Nitrospinae bacterium]|nr:UDP-N-acetylglucosamine 2-epimerase (non-hydrolyzing) [Nitrospinota bacterium]